MFKEMRRKNRELETEEAIEILKKCEYGILSTVGENEYPYGVPVSYIYYNDAIYFHSAIEGNKLDNILNNNKVSFCVVGDTEVLPHIFSTNYESVIIFGKATEVFEGEKISALIEILNKYSKEYLQEGKEYIKNASAKVKLVKISIDHISGKARK